MDNEHAFTFKSGITVRLQRVDQRFVAKVKMSARNRFIADNSKPICPTYTVLTAGGDPETYEHNETTITESRWQADVELQERWQEYQRLATLLRAYEITETVRAIVIEGVLDEPSARWIEKCKYYGLEIPDDPRDCKYEWICDEVPNIHDRVNLAVAIQKINDPVEAAAQAAVESFRN